MLVSIRKPEAFLLHPVRISVLRKRTRRRLCSCPNPRLLVLAQTRKPRRRSSQKCRSGGP